jgi:hypothetical protein
VGNAMTGNGLDQKRRAARRTAFVLGLVALAVFCGFIASVVLK